MCRVGCRPAEAGKRVGTFIEHLASEPDSELSELHTVFTYLRLHAINLLSACESDSQRQPA
jgi:hypothetical protein